ncbi:hypothetical protein, partial [Pseudomonas sp. 3A(2025)]
QNVTLQADQLNNRGNVQAGINPDNTRNTTGTVTAKARTVVNTGTLAASNAVNITATQKLDNRTSGQIASGTALTLDASTLDNLGGLLSGLESVNIKAARLDNSAGTVVSNGVLNLNLSDSLTNRNGDVVSGGDLQLQGTAQVNNQSGRLSSKGAMTLASASLDNSNQGVIVASGSALSLNAASLNNSAGTVQSAGSLNATSLETNNTGGSLIAQAGDLQLNGA